MLSQEYFEYPGTDVANASLNVNFGLDVHEQVGLKHECCSMVLQVAAFELGCTAGRGGGEGRRGGEKLLNSALCHRRLLLHGWSTTMLSGTPSAPTSCGLILATSCGPVGSPPAWLGTVV